MTAILIGWSIIAAAFLLWNYSAHRAPRVVDDHAAVLADHFPEQEAS